MREITNHRQRESGLTTTGTSSYDGAFPDETEHLPQEDENIMEGTLGLFHTVADYLKLPHHQGSSDQDRFRAGEDLQVSAYRHDRAGAPNLREVNATSASSPKLAAAPIRFSRMKGGLTEQYDSPVLSTPISSSLEEESVKRKHDVRMEASNLYNQMVSFLGGVLEAVEQGRSFEPAPGYAIIDAIVNSPVSRDQWFLTIDEIASPSDPKSFLIFHHANVAIRAICMSITMRLSKEEQCRIGLAALMHDIGKVLIPDDILFKSGGLSDEEWKIIREYPSHSYRILNSLEPEYHFVAECALQVNERMDGSGSPYGIMGEAIHPYARMIGLVDVHEAMTSSRPYRKKLLHYDAIKEILRTRKSGFSRNHIMALLKTFSIFPLNSYVKLNSGVTGKIIEVYENLPMRPKVEVVYDPEGIPLATPFVIDLSTQSFLYITAQLREDQISDIHPGTLH